MTIPHVPVLAGEAIELLDPQPGQTVVDCTFGAGGHARLLAGRIGAGTLVAIDRDPIAAERFTSSPQSSRAKPVHPRSFGEGCSSARGGRGADAVLDLGISSMPRRHLQRGFSIRRRALDMRRDRDSRASHELVKSPSRATWRRSSANSARAPSAADSLAIVRARQKARRTDERSSTSSPRRARAAASPRPSAKALTGAADRATTSWAARRGACRRWDLLRSAASSARRSFHSLEDRSVKRFLVARAGLHLPTDLRLRAGASRRPSSSAPGDAPRRGRWWGGQTGSARRACASPEATRGSMSALPRTDAEPRRARQAPRERTARRTPQYLRPGALPTPCPADARTGAGAPHATRTPRLRAPVPLARRWARRGRRRVAWRGRPRPQWRPRTAAHGRLVRSRAWS